jgi:aminoglycoside phosphotransferase (APT) family kinase protein
MADILNHPRKGEELPVPKLLDYLTNFLPEVQKILQIKQFRGGYSNLTYLLETNAGPLVLRRPPIGANIKSAHDMSREFKVLSLLFPLFHKIPKPIHLCSELDVIGAPFYLMEKVHGLILRNALPPSVSLHRDMMANLSESFVKNLVDLHAIDTAHPDIASLGKPEGYAQRQVAGWTERYRNAETFKAPAMDFLMEYLPSAIPSTRHASLIHNDYKYDNLVLNEFEPSEIMAILDWEMCTLGDPLMDLGTSLAYWFEASEMNDLVKGFANLTWLPGNKSRQEIWDYYGSVSGRNVSDSIFYYAFGCFKVGTIIQQIYVRFAKGITNDPRFAHLDKLVLTFGHRGKQAVISGSIS